MSDNKNQELIDGMRACAAFMEAHPNLQKIHSPQTLMIFPDGDLAQAVKGMGEVQKAPRGDWFVLEKRFSPMFSIEWLKGRKDVCERVVTGTTTIPAVPERTLPAEPERVVETYEWRCPDSLLAQAAEVRAIIGDTPLEVVNSVIIPEDMPF
jgi:hypothetical protein